VRAVVVGNVTEDLVFSLPRLPREGETLIASGRLADIGGKGLNQALLLARAGCAARLVAAVGADAAGRRARDLAARELPDAALVTVDAPTDQSIIYVAEGGENHIVSSAFAADALTPEAARAAMGGIGPGDAVVVQGNLSAATTHAVLSAGRAAGTWTVANPSPIRWDWWALLPLADLVIVNRTELADLAGAPTAAAALRARGAGAVLLTLGAEGACLLDERGETRMPAAAATAVDTAGAGDTFAAAFVAARLAGLGAQAALRGAAAAAALTVSRRGTFSAFPTREEMRDCLACAGASA
jgi:ribokinase